MEDKRYYSDAGPENLHLMGDLVLVKPEQQEFEGRIYIPPSARPERGGDVAWGGGEVWHR